MKLEFQGNKVEINDDELNSSDLRAAIELIEQLQDTAGDSFTAHVYEAKERLRHRWHYCDTCLRSKMRLERLEMMRHNVIEEVERLDGVPYQSDGENVPDASFQEEDDMPLPEGSVDVDSVQPRAHTYGEIGTFTKTRQREGLEPFSFDDPEEAS